MFGLQDIGDHVTLPEVQGRMFIKLQELVDIDSVMTRLRNARSEPLPLQAKIELWNELRRRCFLLLIAMTWALPAIDLLVHVYITILGRHLYLEQVMREHSLDKAWRLRFPASPSKQLPRMGNAPPYLPKLSLAQQNSFLTFTDHCVSEGLRAMVTGLQPSVDAHTQSINLQDATPLSAVRLDQCFAYPPTCCEYLVAKAWPLLSLPSVSRS